MMKRIALLALVALAMTSVPLTANADVIRVPAAAFAPPNANGLMLFNFSGVGGTAPVNFPTPGWRICKFSMVYQDAIPTHAIVAWFMKKPFTVGVDPATPASTLAQVRSPLAGTDPTVGRKSANVQDNLIVADAFYWVRVSRSGNSQFTFPLTLLGLEIEHKATCP